MAMGTSNKSDNNKGRVWLSKADEGFETPVKKLLQSSHLESALKKQKKILIKPNLVNTSKPPVTTPVQLVGAIVDCLRSLAPHAEILVGDGTGSLDYDTDHVFKELGYRGMAIEKDVRLVDLNLEPAVRLEKRELKRWPQMHIPQIVMESYLISVPVLKAHTLAGVTLTMKNMVGICPPSHYCQGGHWKKSSFHHGIDEALADLNRYRHADFSIIDATIGMSESHLWGHTCDPPPGLLIAGYDPLAVDAFGCKTLNIDWRHVGHIAMVNGELGIAEPLQVLEV